MKPKRPCVFVLFQGTYFYSSALRYGATWISAQFLRHSPDHARFRVLWRLIFLRRTEDFVLTDSGFPHITPQFKWI